MVRGKQSKTRGLRAAIRDMHPHRIPNPPNAIPEVNLAPWQARRAHIQLTDLNPRDITMEAIRNAITQSPTVSDVTAEFRILRIFVYLRNQSTSAPGGNTELIPYDFSRSVPGYIKGPELGRFTRETSPTQNGAIGFDFGSNISNQAHLATLAVPIASVIGSDCYVDVLFRSRR
jgi:hypothetical protein